MGKEFYNQKIFIKNILERSKKSKEKTIYLIKYSNEDIISITKKKLKKKKKKKLRRKNIKLDTKRTKMEKNNNITKDNIINLLSDVESSFEIKDDNEINIIENNIPNNKQIKDKELYEKYQILQSELNILKENNLKLKEELEGNEKAFDYLKNLLENVSNENKILKKNIIIKKEELNLLNFQFNLKDYDSEKSQILQLNNNLKKNYWEQKIEKNNLKKKLIDLEEDNQLLIKKNEEIEKEKLKIVDEYNDKKECSKNRIVEKELIILELNEKIKKFKKEDNYIFNDNINNEIEEWKEKYENLNIQYEKLSDALKRIKNKNEYLNNIYIKYKALYGEIE